MFNAGAGFFLISLCSMLLIGCQTPTTAMTTTTNSTVRAQRHATASSWAGGHQTGTNL
ncbi:MAG TPA: hypothetical protein VGI85_05595 [Chthoniobacterales bacterium]|jgi:hypothetical protein